MRNRDRVQELERELGRYQKKVGDLQKQNARLAKEALGIHEMSIGIDAWMAQVAMKYGEETKDPETGEKTGWRLFVPLFDARETCGKYEVHTWKIGEGGNAQYVTGVGERIGDA